MKTNPLFLNVAALILGAMVTVNARPGTSVFTYQGRLTQDDAPARGDFEMVFTLHRDAVAFQQATEPVVVDPVTIADGLFSVELDFGDEVFDGSPLWLDIALRPSGAAEPFVNLFPRQKVGASPNAITSLRALSLPPQTVAAGMIAPGAVTTETIADGAVGTAKIAQAAVNTAHLAPSSVTGSKVAPGSLVLSHFAPGAAQLNGGAAMSVITGMEVLTQPEFNVAGFNQVIAEVLLPEMDAQSAPFVLVSVRPTAPPPDALGFSPVEYSGKIGYRIILDSTAPQDPGGGGTVTPRRVRHALQFHLETQPLPPQPDGSPAPGDTAPAGSQIVANYQVVFLRLQ